MAAAAALNRGGGITDTRGALGVLLTQPFGNALLFLVAVGLAGYASWRVLDALYDPERHGTSARGLVVRAGSVIRALVYGMLGLEALRLARGLRGSSSGHSARQARLWAARILDLPFGDWMVAIIGLVVIAYGVSEIVKSVKERTDKMVDATRLPSPARRSIVNIARFGVAARALLIVVLGIFLVRAALHHDASEAVGPRESILELVGAFNSQWVLGAIALGLIAYGVDQAVHARCRRIRAPV